jgi:hypothetical protein
MKRTRALLFPMLLWAALPGCHATREDGAELEKARAEKLRAEDEARRLTAEKKVIQAKIDALLQPMNSEPDEATRRAFARELEIARANARDGGASPGGAAKRCHPEDPLCADR